MQKKKPHHKSETSNNRLPSIIECVANSLKTIYYGIKLIIDYIIPHFE